MYCASCQTEMSDEVITHFKKNHYFRPKQEQQVEPQVEVSYDNGFFNDSFHVSVKCPVCYSIGNMEVQQNLKSIIITCGNIDCQQVKLYRLVVDRPQVQETVSK